MANPHLSTSPSPASNSGQSILTDTSFIKKFEDVDSAIRNNKFDYLLRLVKDKKPGAKIKLER
jgi:hypothetical protein